MRHTIELSEAGEASLRHLARGAGQDVDAVLGALVDGLLASGLKVDDEPAIRATPNVLGGDARIRNTRIPVWLVVAHKKWGETDADILTQYPTLNASDLAAAWDYYVGNSERVDEERRANEEAE